MTSHSTHISVAHGDGAVVTVKPTDDGRWFQMLHWYITSGAAARLYRDHKAAPLLLDALGHLRDRSSGLSVAPIESLRPLLGLGDSTIYEAKAAILRSPDGLALETSPNGWVFELFPGRPFAGRGRVPPTVDIPDSGNADPIPGTRNGFRERGISPSHSPSAQKDQDKEQQQPISLTLEDARDEIAAAAIALARKAGIPEATALEHLNAHGARKLYNAIVEARTRKGAPIRDVSGWVRSALARGYELPDHWAMECGRREREARMRGDAANLLRKMAAAWSGDDMAVILAAFGTAEQLAAWLDEREPFGLPWRSYGADRLGRKIADAVMAGTKQESKA